MAAKSLFFAFNTTTQMNWIIKVEPSYDWGIICQDWFWGLEVTSRQPKGVKLAISKIANYNSSLMKGICVCVQTCNKEAGLSTCGPHRGTQAWPVNRCSPTRGRRDVRLGLGDDWESQQSLHFNVFDDLHGGNSRRSRDRLVVWNGEITFLGFWVLWNCQMIFDRKPRNSRIMNR